MKSKINRREFLERTAIGGLAVASTPGMHFLTNHIPNTVNMNDPLPFRQIHLDFHTSRYIEKIAVDFDPKEFVSVLKKAHVNSVTCFGRCHHGYMYYDSKLFPERVHPHLSNKKLLLEQVRECHKNDIRVPIYFTIQWDHFTARNHPEWLAVEPDGSPVGQGWYEAGFYHFLDVYTPYREFLKKSLKELFEIIGEVDGLFLDIVNESIDSSNIYCREGMRKKGLEPSNQVHRKNFYREVIQDFKHEMTSFVHKMDKKVDIFYNSGHIGPYIRDSVNAYSHFELESLPSGGWGYLHFPITARYTRTLNKEILGMTGKFHTSWGDFHSFKNKASLEFEIFTNLAFGAKCSIGDQLHPSGTMDPFTYDLIGSVYSQVEKKEKWCNNVKPVTEIGLMNTEEFKEGYTRYMPGEMIGAARILQEGQKQFDIVDSKSNFENYKLLILPDHIEVNEELASKLRSYIKNGGLVLATFESGLDPEKKNFKMSEWGVKKISNGPVDLDGDLARGKFYKRNNFAQYIIPEGVIGKNLPQTEHVLYIRGMDIEADFGSEILLSCIDPYFNRNYEHFCSHRQTPSEGKKGNPAVVRKGNVTYFAHPVFSQYYYNAPKWVKVITLNAVDQILQDPIVVTDGPSSLISTINDQVEENRYVLHLLHYIPEQRGREFEVVEDVIALNDISISLYLDNEVKEVRLVPENIVLETKENKQRIEFTIPRIYGHQMIELGY